MRAASELVLGVSGSPVTRRDGQWYVHHAFGRIVELIALRVGTVRYHTAVLDGSTATTCDYPLKGTNLEILPWGPWHNTLAALKRPDRLLWNAWRLARESDAIFIRGNTPLVWWAHWLARCMDKPVVHWIAANPMAIMRAERRGYGSVLDRLGVAYAYIDRVMTRAAMHASKAHVLANGAEAAELYKTPRTTAVVSTSITLADFLVREDTCQGDTIRLLFVGFIRPEKGVEYLIRAMPLVRCDRPVHLALVGSWDQFPAERKRLQGIIGQLGLEDCVHWEGYAAFGDQLFNQMDRSDVLVLPTLSEGTPRVLVEARARSLPLVSTNVGGIPTSVRHGEDGLLVSSRDPQALGQAISRIIGDGGLRRCLIQRGRERVRSLTIERFVDVVLGLLSRHPDACGSRDAAGADLLASLRADMSGPMARAESPDQAGSPPAPS